MTTASVPIHFATPYIPLHLTHFPHPMFTTAAGFQIFPMWSGEGNLSYLVMNPQTSQAILIDPDLEILGSYLLTLQQQPGLQLIAVMDTHNHAEHLSAAPELKQLFQVPYYMHEDAPSSQVTHRVQDQEQRVLGGMPVTFLHTPGHTPHLMTIQIDHHIFTGDSLFLKSCGRADFPGVSNAREQFDSLQRLAALPDDTVIHPGHDYHNELTLTLGESKRVNARLQFANRDKFAEFMDQQYAQNEKPEGWEWYVAMNAR